MDKKLEVKDLQISFRTQGGIVKAVRNISLIIEETAESAEVVKKVAESLQQNVENLNGTAESLGDNMSGLKTEIAVFKTEQLSEDQ